MPIVVDCKKSLTINGFKSGCSFYIHAENPKDAESPICFEFKVKDGELQGILMDRDELEKFHNAIGDFLY